MVKLIQKCGYVKAAKAAGYMKYIATREGVERIKRNGPVSDKQQEMIANILKDYPDAEELFEYEDYRANPCLRTASAFISMALDCHVQEDEIRSGYLKYMATRPRAERIGKHGLFSSEEDVDLDSAMNDLSEHDGNAWTIIYSLRREDAIRLGYDHADSWRNLILHNSSNFAESLKSTTAELHWYAAFHDEGSHPHIHMMLWSDNPKAYPDAARVLFGFLLRRAAESAA